MSRSELVPATVFFICIFLIVFVFAVVMPMDIKSKRANAEVYKSHCTANGGKPLHNGKHWECFK